MLKSIIFVVKSFLGNFYRHLSIFSGHIARRRRRQHLSHFLLLQVEKSFFANLSFHLSSRTKPFVLLGGGGSRERVQEEEKKKKGERFVFFKFSNIFLHFNRIILFPNQVHWAYLKWSL